VKRRELIERIEKAAEQQGVSFTFVRPGGNHDIFSFGGRMVPIGRHREIPERTAQGILRQLGA
jgi:hypothetical protein